MTFRSEIRQSTINELFEKVSRRSYRKYLYKVILKRIRGFNDKIVTFDFPITALVGPNGGGKTTILGAVACAYKIIKPQQFFAKSGILDESMLDWQIEYEIIDRDVNQRDSIVRSASFVSFRWRRDGLTRDVLVFGVSRTVPANERAELRKCASTAFEFTDDNIQLLHPEVSDAVGKILGKDVSTYRNIRIDTLGRVSLLSGRTENGASYSEFHFGAGEFSIIRMVIAIENVPNSSLILVEEIENGLHPVATIRMVEYLIDVAHRKSSQVIFTTHSNDALKPLPSNAIWSAIRNDVFQGKLDIHALRAITGQIDAQLAIFVEDQFAATWVKAILRQFGGVALDHIEVYAMEGDSIAVNVNRHHNMDPSRRFPSVCLIDGDSRQRESSVELVFRLPGEGPESYVFDKVMEVFDQFRRSTCCSIISRFRKNW